MSLDSDSDEEVESELVKSHEDVIADFTDRIFEVFFEEVDFVESTKLAKEGHLDNKFKTERGKIILGGVKCLTECWNDNTAKELKKVLEQKDLEIKFMGDAKKGILYIPVNGVRVLSVNIERDVNGTVVLKNLVFKPKEYLLYPLQLSDFPPFVTRLANMGDLLPFMNIVMKTNFHHTEFFNLLAVKLPIEKIRTDKDLFEAMEKHFV